jgi:hypothetical protein
MKLMYEKDILDQKDRYINDYGHVMDIMDQYYSSGREPIYEPKDHRNEEEIIIAETTANEEL